MPTYRFEIQKGDHYNSHTQKADLHVHVYYNQGQSRKLLGRYRIPSLEPVFASGAHELNGSETKAIRDWLSEPKQIKKLQDFLSETLFDLHKALIANPSFGEIVTDDGGRTSIVVRIPVSERFGTRKG